MATYGFTIITIPKLQWGPVAQYKYLGSMSSTNTLKVPTVVEFALGPGMNPECMAVGTVSWSGAHGAMFPAAWVTVWLLSWNWNCSTSPGFALTMSG